MDYYLNDDNVYQRLEDEYKIHQNLILAVDFDDTLYDCHKKGRTYNTVISLLQRWKNYSTIIIWSASPESRYPFIEEYCLRNNIPFDGINHDSCIQSGGRKIYANAFIDDRAGLSVIIKCLDKLINKIEKGEIHNDKDN